MHLRVEELHVGGGIIPTTITVLVSAASGWLGGSLEFVREFLSGMTQPQATLFVGVFAAALTQGGIWARWYFDRRRKGKSPDASTS